MGDEPSAVGVEGTNGPRPGDPDPATEVVVRELQDQLRRALADLDNLRKRYDRELARERAAERSTVTAAWLPIVDNLDRALEHADRDAQALIDGVRAVRDQAVATLSRLGFPPFDDVGRPFDASRDEAVAVADDDAPAGTVLAVVRPGYGTEASLLRPAGVVVSRGRQ